MKNAKSKMTAEGAASRGWKLMERDMMPESVATDLLCTLERLTNTMRKQYADSRVRVFQAVAVRKPVEVKLAARMAAAKLVQLGKWASRTAKKRRGLQRKYEVAIKLPEETTKQQLLKQRLVAGLDVLAARMDLVVDAIQNELDGRDNCELDALVECPVCGGSKKSKYTGTNCGCCNATGTITERSRRAKAMIAKDISDRLSASVRPPHTREYECECR